MEEKVGIQPNGLVYLPRSDEGGLVGGGRRHREYKARVSREEGIPYMHFLDLHAARSAERGEPLPEVSIPLADLFGLILAFLDVDQAEATKLIADIYQ